MWAKNVAKRRGKQKANTALCRKLAALMFAMWRDKKPYNPKHLEQKEKMKAAMPA